MNPLVFFRSAPYIVIALLGAALIWTTGMYHSERDNRVALTASVQALGEAAKAHVEEVEKQSEANLKTVKEHHESLEPTIRADAVRNYRLAHPERVRVVRTSGGTLPGIAPGIKLDDEAKSELVPDSALIENCAEDALKLSAWQEWCQLNHCPIKE